MVVEREIVMGGDSGSLGNRFIIVQAKQTDDDGPEEIGYYSNVRRFNTTGYYRLDLHTGDVSILPRTVQDQGSMNSMVALGSKFYIFGRQINNSDSKKPCSSYFLDLADSQKSSSSSSCWKRAHPLTTDRLPLGGAVAFDGKMYFFRNSDDFSSFCEVFDPTLPKPQWRCIKSTPTLGGAEIHPTVATPVLADHKNNRIIVFLSNICSMYAYYPCEDRWECLVEGFLVEGYRRWFFYLQPVTIVDGVIYFHRPKLNCFFMAFDIATQEWLNVTSDAVENYKFYLPLPIYPCLLHLGNDILCLLTSRYKDRESDQGQTTLVHVVQFKVKLINNNGTKEVIVTPLPSRSHYYDLDSRCALYHCLAL